MRAECHDAGDLTSPSEVFPWPEVKFEQRCIAAACAARGSVDFEMSMRRRTAAGSVPRTGSKLPVPIWLEYLLSRLGLA
jgi:hypothetical protein